MECPTTQIEKSRNEEGSGSLEHSCPTKKLAQPRVYLGSAKIIRIVSSRNPAVEKLGRSLVTLEKDP